MVGAHVAVTHSQRRGFRSFETEAPHRTIASLRAVGGPGTMPAAAAADADRSHLRR
jgi:hypothetical protein